MSDDFDPFGDQPAPPSARPERRGSEAGFEPRKASMPAPRPRQGLELGAAGSRIGSLWVGPGEAVATYEAREPVALSAAGARGGRILVVCTGNVCRSPYIHLRLGHALADLGVEVASAGTGALVGRPVDPGSRALLDAAGVESDDFRARQLTAPIVREADLVLTAARAHRREVVQEVPSALRRTFTLKDFADLIEGLGAADVAQADGESLVARLADAAVARRHLVHARSDEDADIVDPFRRGPDVFAEMERQAVPPLMTVIEALHRVKMTR